LLLSGWDGQGDFLDPMCGSGTFWLKQLWLPVIFRQTLT
jgi:23S rRNA G2445 N2-methylase RlmL